MDYGGDMQHDEHPLDQAGSAGSGRLYDPDGHFDSSSSSGSDNHSSPADSSYTATSQHDWTLDGLSLDLALPWSPGAPSSLAALDPGFSHVLSSKQSGGRDYHKGHSVDPLTLTHDFWGASAPAEDQRQLSATDGADTAALNPMTGEPDPAASRTGESDSALRTQSGDGMQMDFDDMVHGDVCGPATLSSSPHPEVPASSTSAGITAQLAQDDHHASFSMPIDLLAVNAGIAPSLTNVDGLRSGQATPDRFVSPAPESLISPQFASTRATSVSSTTPQQSEATSDLYSLRRSSTTTRSSRASTRDHSVSRASDASTSSSSAVQQQRAAKAASKQATAASAVLGPGAVNLVARDAVLAAKLIPRGAAPSADELVAAANDYGGGPAPKLLVLGIPTVGAKSRVETQIKISLALVRPQHAIKREDGIDTDATVGYVSTDGGLDERAAKDLERVETWSHLRLPKHLALKSKEKKGPGVVKPKPAVPVPEPPAESVLNLEVAVVSASDPRQQIHICDNCEQRELKRSLRRKDAKGKTFTAPIPEPDPNDPPRNEAEERSKVVVFNAQEIVDFKTGEVILPTRVTCYCRHHKEKKGFCITYSMRDYRGHIVARGMSPAIMITDDHKTNTSKAAAAAAAAASANASAAEDAGPKRKNSKSATAPKNKKDKVPSSSASAATSSGRSRRGASGRSRRGQTDSDDEQDASRKSRPYDSDARPSRKRSANQHRSPMFAMTPLAPSSQQASKPPSPVLPAGSPQLPLSAVPQGNGFSSALGLDGLSEAGDASMTAAPSALLDSRRSSACEEAIDWRAGLSTPPLSPGSSAPSVAETFHSIFSGYPSPNPALQDTRASQEPSVPGAGSIPSFAIPATEPIPASFAPSWSLQQQPQQVNPPAAPPRINRVIPGEGPVHGGIEVTVLGDNFVRDLTCVFGDNAAVPTHYWSANTLVCVLPPSANPGPVVVGIKGVPLTPDQGAGLQLFTYKDTSDRSLLELALQVVGMQMTGRIEDAAAIAMRIVANGSGSNSGGPSGIGGHAPAQGEPSDTAALAATLETATRSAYATPSGSQASSRRSSFNASGRPAVDSRSTGRSPLHRETRNFEGIVIKFLSLLDLDPSSIPGAAPSLPAAQPPISLVNQQRHTLLHLAAVLGFHRLVNFLLSRGIALDTADRNGYTALHFAALYGRVTIARMLVDGGANTAARTLAGQTPLDVAIEKDDIDVEDLLVARGAEPSATARTPTLPVSDFPRRVTEKSPSSAGNESPRSLAESRRSSIASTQSRSSFFFEAAEDDSSDSGTDYPSDWTVEHDSWDEHDEADGEESEQELTPIPRSRLGSRNASSASLQHLPASEGELTSDRASPRSKTAHLSEMDDREGTVPFGQPIDRSGASEALQSSWLTQKLRPTAEGVSTAWEKAKATRFGVSSMQLPDVGNALQLGKARRRRATESAVHEDTDGNESTATTTSRFAASPFRDWTPAFRTPQWWHSNGKTPSSPPPQYSPADSLALAPPPEKSEHSEIVSARPIKARTDSFRAIRARVKRRLSSTSHSTDDTDAETDGGSAAFDAHRPASLWADVMLFAFWIPVLVAVLWYAYRNWAEYGGPVVAGLTETLMPARIARILA